MTGRADPGPGDVIETGISLADRIKTRALELGFDAVGIAPAEPGEHHPFYLDWLAANFHGDQSYLARPDRLARRRNLGVILPGVRSLVVVGAHYGPGLPVQGPVASDPARGRISIYARGRDYHQVRLDGVEGVLPYVGVLVGVGGGGGGYVDTGPLMERDHALRAELGFIGKNCNLIQPRRGSWLFLGVLLLTLPLEAERSAASAQDPEGGRCGSCTRCLEACPTGALVRPFYLDSRRCISYLTTALKGSIPRALRPLVGNWVFGCDICQAVCPWNRFSRPGELFGTPPAKSPPLLELMALSEEGFQARYGHTPIGHIKRARFLRNVAVALGNWGSPDATPVLMQALDEPHPLIREHAAWALGRIDDSPARNALKEALAQEREPTVVEQISLALNPGRQAPPD